MKVLYIVWKSFGREDIRKEFDARGYETDEYFLNPEKNLFSNHLKEQELISLINGNGYQFVFSWNYFPVVALACNVCKVPYASWIYDSPCSSIWHCSVVSPYNYIFLFDRQDYLELKEKGINTVYYLPLAVDAKKYARYKLDKETEEVYSAPISFIGSTYAENQRSFKKLNMLERYDRGYIDGLLQAQKRIYGNLLLEERITPEIEKKLQQLYNLIKDDNTFVSYKKYYGQFVLPKCITAMERQEILKMLSERYPLHLYTKKKTPLLPHAINRGMAGSGKESSFIFRCSKINLNITLRSIRTGIPLRAFEIIGNGGFLLTNYQQDFQDCFEAGTDYVYYDSYEDLLAKADYYLSHEEERKQIAENGYEKVKKYHTYRHRMDVIIRTMGME